MQTSTKNAKHQETWQTCREELRKKANKTITNGQQQARKTNEHKYTFRIIQHNPNLSFPPFQSYLGTGTTLGVSTVSSFVRATATGVDNSSRLIWGSVHHPHDLLSPWPSSISFFDVWNKDTKVSSTYWSHTDRLMTYIFQFSHIIDINITLVKDASWKSSRSLFLGHCLVEGDFPLVVMLHRMPFLIFDAILLVLFAPVSTGANHDDRLQSGWKESGRGRGKAPGPKTCRTFRFDGIRIPSYPLTVPGKQGSCHPEKSERSNHHPWKTRKKDVPGTRRLSTPSPRAPSCWPLKAWQMRCGPVRWVRNHVQLGHNHGEKDENEEYL